MLPYFLLLFISAVFPLMFYYFKGNSVVHYSRRNMLQDSNKLMLIIFFVGLFILLSLRDISVGTDLIEYKIIFERCSIVQVSELKELRWEIGYTFYNKLISLISNEYRVFLIVTAFIVILPIYKFYSKEKKYIFLLIVLFINMPCFLMIFSGLRQAIATSIGIFAYMAIENKKNIRGILLIFLAAAFHVSAFVLFLLFPAFYLKIKVKHLIYIIPMLIAVYIFRIPIFGFIISLVPSNYSEFYGKIQQTGAFGMMLLFLVFLTFAFVILDESIMSKKDYCMRNILLIATVFQFFVPIHSLIQRASYYFLIFVPIAIISVVQAPKRKLKNISDMAVVVMSCFFVLYFFYNAIFSTDNLLNVFPYRFFWSGVS